MSVNYRHPLFTAALLMCAWCATSARRCTDCGTTAVPYPLSTGTNCRDQSYKIRCDAGSLKFDTLNNTYSITSITPATQRFMIQPASFVSNTCVTADLPTEGIQLNNTLPSNVTSSNTIMYLNCSDSLLRSPLNCSSTSLCHTYINATAEASPCEDSPICCTFWVGGSMTSYSIRVQDGGCRGYRSFVNLDTSLPVSQWPRPGVEIQWVSPQEPVCGSLSDCDSNSLCGPDPSENGVSKCYCDSGFYWNPIGGLCAESISSSVLRYTATSSCVKYTQHGTKKLLQQCVKRHCHLINV